MKTILRFFLIIYLPIAAVLYFVLLHGHYSRIADLQADLSDITGSEQHQSTVRQADQMREKHRQQLKEIVREFALKAEGFDKLSLPVFVGEVAKSAEVKIVKLEVRDECTAHGCEFLSAEVEVRGPFARLRSFLTELEENEQRFVSVDKVQIEPVRGSDSHKLAVRFSVVFSTPACGELAHSEEGPVSADETRPVRKSE